jgi:hypothetical protein
MPESTTTASVRLAAPGPPAMSLSLTMYGDHAGASCQGVQLQPSYTEECSCDRPRSGRE